ncbi:hypothetical protein ABZP36_030267, partial [Zizania latifolia]
LCSCWIQVCVLAESNFPAHCALVASSVCFSRPASFLLVGRASGYSAYPAFSFLACLFAVRSLLD